MTLTDREKLEEAKPRFYYTDLNNYTSVFLQEIIEWQQMYLIAVQDELSVERNTREENRPKTCEYCGKSAEYKEFCPDGAPFYYCSEMCYDKYHTQEGAKGFVWITGTRGLKRIEAKK